MIGEIEKLLQDYARYSFIEGTISENTMNHLVEDAQNYVAELNYTQNKALERLSKQAQDLNMGYKPKKIELDLESMASNEVNLNCNIKGLKK
jgi:site-specific recombinase XerD